MKFFILSLFYGGAVGKKWVVRFLIGEFKDQAPGNF